MFSAVNIFESGAKSLFKNIIFMFNMYPRRYTNNVIILQIMTELFPSFKLISSKKLVVL